MKDGGCEEDGWRMQGGCEEIGLRMGRMRGARLEDGGECKKDGWRIGRAGEA